MTNYEIEQLPVLKPEDWMTVEIGDEVGSITLDRLRDYLISGEQYFTEFNHTTDASVYLSSLGLNFYPVNNLRVDSWEIEGEKADSFQVTKREDSANVKLIKVGNVTETTKIIVKGFDKNKEIVYKALLNVLV